MSRLDDAISSLAMKANSDNGVDQMIAIELLDLAIAIRDDIADMNIDPRVEKAKAAKTLQEQGYSLQKIADLFGLNHGGSVKHLIDKYAPITDKEQRL